MTRLNFRDIATIYAAATFTSISTAAVGGYLWEHIGGNTDFGLIIGGAWILSVGLPSTLVSMETLRKRLGEKSPNTVSAAGGSSRAGRRSIPFSANGRQSHVFLSSIPWLSRLNESQPEVEEIELPTIFTSTVDDNDYSVTIDELETFIRTAWRRQRIGENGLSRPFWTRQHQPRLKPLEYYSRLNVLLSCNGLILDRGKRRSGRLAVSPGLAIKALQSQFSLV